MSGSFGAIPWRKKRGVMPGSTVSNELSSRAQCVHAEVACSLYSMCTKTLSEGVAHGIVRDAVEIERRFTRNAFPLALIGMTSAARTSVPSHPYQARPVKRDAHMGVWGMDRERSSAERIIAVLPWKAFSSAARRAPPVG